MATRAKSKEIVAESQKVFGVVAKILKWVAILLAIITVLAVVVWGISDLRREKDTETIQDATKLILSMPAHGDSPHVSTRPGYAIDYTGSGFSIHCVYRDGSEGIVGDQSRPCKNGPMLYQYVHDTTGKANTVTYAFVQPN